jgi:hypothetical protein
MNRASRGAVLQPPSPQPPHAPVAAEAAEQASLATMVLMQLACWNDLAANDILLATGSYEGFEDPGAVRRARKALARDEPA